MRPKEDEVPLERELTHEQLRARVTDAIRETRCIVIDYQGKSRRGQRKIAPLQVESDMGHDYLHAWDFWREDYRLFRLDRVLGLAVLEEKFDPEKYG